MAEREQRGVPVHLAGLEWRQGPPLRDEPRTAANPPAQPVVPALWVE